MWWLKSPGSRRKSGIGQGSGMHQGIWCVLEDWVWLRGSGVDQDFSCGSGCLVCLRVLEWFRTPGVKLAAVAEGASQGV